MNIVTRFAPSPTGFLHIGSARTALFNWLYAKHTGGKFLLRIEDTDRERSTEPAIHAILEGMKWLELDWDGKEIYQFARAHRHAQIAHKLLENGKAYKCYCSKEELEQMRNQAMVDKLPFKYNGKCRKLNPDKAPDHNRKPVIRIKAPIKGDTVIDDLVQGRVTVQNTQLDDMIMLRSDGTPTYMLAVVVDDHDMMVSHVIRGDDHLTNAFRQKLIYEAMGWEIPKFAHIPLIHGSDGAKLSKRHGALGVEAYRYMGYSPQALRNYLLRLGWSHGDDEIISTEQAIEWFDIAQIGKSPARFDFKKLDNLNAHYIRQTSNENLVSSILPFMQENTNFTCNEEQIKLLTRAMNGLKERAKTLVELAINAMIYVKAPSEFSQDAQKSLDKSGKEIIAKVLANLDAISTWNHDNISAALKDLANGMNIKLGDFIAPIRAAITGSHISPSMFEVMDILGKNEVKNRLENSLHSGDK